jgi:aspartate/methionine/tyrosine aminotransferase
MGPNSTTVKPIGSLISYFSNLVKTNGGINLAQGIPGFQPPDELIEILKQTADSNIHQYAPGIGNFNLLKQLSANYNVELDNLLVVQGATEGLSLIYTYLLKKLNGDFAVMAIEPAYESYSRLPAIFGQKFVGFTLTNGEIDIIEFRKTITDNNIKVVFTATPGNPYGNVLTEREINAILKMAEELGFYLVLDMVYSELFYDTKPYLPILGKSQNLFYVNSFSKSLCITGWRVGYIIASAEHTVELRAIHDYIGLCAPSLLQEALAQFLIQNENGKTFIANFRETIKNNFNLMSQGLIELGFQVPPTQGGCFVWAKMPTNFPDGFLFANELYSKTKVAIIPGEHFGQNYSIWVRLNIARETKEVENGLAHISKFVKEH